MSFAVNNNGMQEFQVKDLGEGRSQVMWPVHCVQGTPGSDFHEKLDRDLKNDKVHSQQCENLHIFSELVVSTLGCQKGDRQKC